MANPVSDTTPRFSRQHLHGHSDAHSKSFSSMLCKSVLFLLFLATITLFPSQAPNFISHTIFTQSWELLHLLVIGVAVCYGLFSRRNSEMGFHIETHHRFDDSLSSHVSRIFHVSPIFEDGYETLFGSDDKSVYHFRDSSQYHRGESMVTVANDASVNNESGRSGSLDSENVSENALEHDNVDVIQAWNSQYSLGESMVILSQPNYGLDKCGRYGQVVDCKPLGLPIRNLKPKISNGSQSSSSLRGSSSSSAVSVDDDKNFGDMSPKNLEEKFNESVSLHSQISWRSSSGRMEMRERKGSPASHQPRFRPLSVDEAQFESLRWRSFRSTKSSSSLATFASSRSRSPVKLSPVNSHSCETPNPKMEESEKQKSYEASNCPPVSQSPSMKMNGDHAPLLNAFHLRRYTDGSLFQNDSQGRSKDEVKDMRGKRGQGLSSSTQETEQDYLKKSEEKPAKLGKASARGKSVRTIRANGYRAEAVKHREMAKNRTTGNEVGKSYGESNAVNLGKNEIRVAGHETPSVGANSKNFDVKCTSPKPFFAKYQKREKEECSKLESVTVKPKEDSEDIEADKFKVPSDEDADVGMTNTTGDAWQEPSEIDKKAGEFIAKFREQIRLQKVASIKSR